MSSISKKEQPKRIFHGEITSGDCDLEKGDEFIIPRPKTSSIKASRGNTYTVQDVYAPTMDNKQSLPSPTAEAIILDDLLQEIVIDVLRVQPTTRRRLTVPIIFSCEEEYQDNHIVGGFLCQPKFCKVLKVEMQHIYGVELQITKTTEKSHLQTSIFVVTFKSKDENKTHEAQTALGSLFKSIKMTFFDEQSGFWTKNKACVRIIQAYSDQNERLHISCEHSEIGLLIYYFSEKNATVFPHLRTTDTTLKRIIKEKFLSLDVALPSSSDLTIANKSFLAQDILKLNSQLQSQPILIILERQRIRLFALVDLVNQVQKEIEHIKRKYESNVVKLAIEPNQIKFLMDIHYDELKVLESNYIDAKIVKNLRKGEFIAPNHLHDAIAKHIMKLATLCTPIQLDIQEEAFRPIAHNEHPNLINIGRQHKCHIDIRENFINYTCDIPRAATQDHISNTLTAAAIKIHQEDLAEQQVDLVVICSTSMLLCNDILKKAGQSVKEEYTQAAKASSKEPFEINSGNLKCRKLLFLPWDIDKTNSKTFYQSIRNFVNRAVGHAIKAHHTSIAFPAIGCGLLNFDKQIIANGMLIEAQNQLLTANVLLQIIFVILPGRPDVFQAFQGKLDSLRKDNVETKDAQMSYHLSTLTLTIISSSAKKQEKCQKALNDHVQKSIAVLEPPPQALLKKWSQPAINKFYKFCHSRHVVPAMNIIIGYLRLFGSKESVREAEIEYYREQAALSEQARLAALTRDVIWAYKRDDNNWEKYSLELNVRIEDVHSHLPKILTFTYTGDKSQKYTIDFTTMIEKCTSNQQQREIIRHADFVLPQYWQVQSNNVEQFLVPTNSIEFKEIRVLFDKTMVNQYTQIIRIDRIQNKPWFMQYSSYKSFSPKKDSERKLFHGCPQQSTILIINSFFNRSFAGVNGTRYGQGAYFSSNASYSHTYAKAHAVHGEKYMFVVNVLVGDSVKGHKSMKTPPSGFDSTTDGDHIFVTYRDDQAYAAYLIIYK